MTLRERDDQAARACGGTLLVCSNEGLGAHVMRCIQASREGVHSKLAAPCTAAQFNSRPI